ncbi:hypothetical protein [Jeotgalibacillus sp. JSM ZJ347]|uniref:hypothetical protein n=1 Tax=Jeotgalibacillus sp. JSM ZJ347 TaxID=3342117 RepID=UPI0035A98FEC
MLSNEIQIVKNKSKKYKKFLEKIEVNPNPVNVNGKHYYEVVYTSGKGEVKGTAVLSPYQEIESEAREAQPLLSKYNGLILSIHAAGSERAKAPDLYFEQPIKLIEEHSLSQLEAGKVKIQEMSQLLEQHKTYFNNIIQTFREAVVISQKDIDHAIRSAVMIDLIHVKLLEIMTKDLSVIEDWVNEMKNVGLWRQLPSNVHQFYEEMLKGKEKNVALLATKRRPSAERWEDQVEEIYQQSSKDIEQEIRGYRKTLRYPAPF